MLRKIVEMEENITKTKLFLYWVIGGFFSSILGVVPAVIYWSKVDASWAIDIPGEIIASSMMLPVGWLFVALIPLSWQLTPAAWLSILAFIWAIRRRKIAPLYLAYGACFIFGLFWPYVFWSMMSV